MTSRHSLSTYSRSFWLTVGVFAVFTLVFTLYVHSEKNIDRMNDLRFESHALSMELRQSSEDLTRMVRSYVATGNPVYKQYYQQILDMRNGKLPRNTMGRNLFWDLVPASLPGTADLGYPYAGQSVPLMDLIKNSGLSEDEFSRLEQAKANSDALTAIEWKAMAMVENPGADIRSTREEAIALLYDEQYRQAKLAILRPIAEARDLMERRSVKLVREAEQFSLRLRILFIIVGVLLVGLLWRAYRALYLTLGGKLQEVYSSLVNLGKGDFSAPLVVHPGMEESIVGWLAVTQARLAKIEEERHLAAEKNARMSRLHSAMSQCSQSILRLDDKEDLLPRICHDAVTIGGLKMAWIGIVEEDTQMLKPVAFFGAGSDYVKELRISVNPDDGAARGPSAYAYLNNQAYWCQDFQNAPITAPWHEKGALQGWRASAALPLINNGKVVGTFNLYSEYLHAFDESVQEMLTEFAIDVSHVLTRFELEAGRLHALQMEELRSYMLERITSTATQKELFLDVVLKVESLLQDCLCSIMLLDKDGLHLRTGAAPSLPPEYCKAIEGVAIGEGVGSCGNALFTGTRTIVSDLSTHPYWREYWPMAEKADLRSCWSEPIFSAQHKIIGAFAIYHREISVPNVFSLQMLEMAANLISIGIERKLSEESLRKLSQAVEQSSNAIVITDTSVNIEYANNVYLKNAGKQLNEVIGRKPSIMRSGKTTPEVYSEMWAQLDRGESWRGGADQSVC